MNNIDKEIIREDIEFIVEYMGTLADKYPGIRDEKDIIRRIDLRINDILRRLDAK